MTQLDTLPANVDVGSGEVLPYSWDFSANVNISGGETISSAAVTLIDIASNSNYSQGVSGAASISGAVVTQTIFNIVYKHTYAGICKITTSLGRTWQARTTFNGVL